MPNAVCLKCGNVLPFREEQTGRPVACPKCGEGMRLRGSHETPEPPEPPQKTSVFGEDDLMRLRRAINNAVFFALLEFGLVVFFILVFIGCVGAVVLDSR